MGWSIVALSHKAWDFYPLISQHFGWYSKKTKYMFQKWKSNFFIKFVTILEGENGVVMEKTDI